jgi:Predicted membrane protein (DUF2254)
VTDLEITRVLNTIGNKGREEINASLRDFGLKQSASEATRLGPVSKTVTYSGYPRAVTQLDTDALVREAQLSGGIIAMACGVGDTLVYGNAIMRVHGSTSLSEENALGAIHLGAARTFVVQDPKYPIRILVDIAIRALSPAVNDPTTAVQAIDQIEDLLRRIIRKDLETSHSGIQMAICASSLCCRPGKTTWRSPSMKSANLEQIPFRSCVACGRHSQD